MSLTIFDIIGEHGIGLHGLFIKCQTSGEHIGVSGYDPDECELKLDEPMASAGAVEKLICKLIQKMTDDNSGWMGATAIIDAIESGEHLK